MKKIIIITCILTSLLIILNVSGVLDALLMLLLVGAVPGTEYTVPWGVMLTVILGIVWLVVFKVFLIEPLQSLSTQKKAKKHVTRKKRMPKRRFSELYD